VLTSELFPDARAFIVSDPSIQGGSVSGLILDSSPEEAGGRGSNPSLATTFVSSLQPSKTQFCSVSFQNFGPRTFASRSEHLAFGAFFLRSRFRRWEGVGARRMVE
jgi:hypothetical protein